MLEFFLSISLSFLIHSRADFFTGQQCVFLNRQAAIPIYRQLLLPIFTTPSFASHTSYPDLSSRGNLLQLLDNFQMGFTGGIPCLRYSRCVLLQRQENKLEHPATSLLLFQDVQLPSEVPPIAHSEKSYFRMKMQRLQELIKCFHFVHAIFIHVGREYIATPLSYA